MSEPRIHHYIPQCYLKGFSVGGSKKSKLVVFDYEKRKRFETVPRNICAQRDYNRINVEGQDPGAIEKKYAEIESEIARSLKNLNEGASFEGDDKFNILYLMAMIVTRSPSQRENLRQFEERVIKQMMLLNVQTKERWESSNSQAGLEDTIGYEAAKKFAEDGAYTISATNEHHIQLEMKGTDVVFDNLTPRGWRLFRANHETGPFITSDLPVRLVWKNIENEPELLRRPPGFGLMGTAVVFPVSRSIAILGTFEDDEDQEVETSLNAVANSNTLALFHFDRFVIASDRNFNYLAEDGSIARGQSFFDVLDRRKVDG
jgi:hypothetical protein